MSSEGFGMPKDPDRQHWIGVSVFYAVFVIMIALEGSVVGLILFVADHAGASKFRLEIAWAIFVIGGISLGQFQLSMIKTGKKMVVPILRFCCWLQRRLGYLGFVLNALFVGQLGASVALKQTGNSHAKQLQPVGAILWSTLWIPIYYFGILSIPTLSHLVR